MARRIIIDTDPGQDDAVAILTALASPELAVLGIVAAAGNVPLALTTANALKVVELAGRPDVPVFAGADRPMKHRLVTAEHVHGKTGLDGVDLPEPALRAQPRHGIDFIIDTLRAEPAGSVTLVTLGPLTNVAMALLQAPDIAPRIAEIAMVLGSFSEAGNITPAADFNTYVDPEAADVVLRSGLKLSMITMDVTHQMRSTRARLDAFSAGGNRCGRAVDGWLSFSEQFDLAKYGWEGAPLHDPCIIAWLLQPALFGGRQINVSVELTGTYTYGMSVADWWRVTDLPRNVFFMREVDVPAIYALLHERIARLP